MKIIAHLSDLHFGTQRPALVEGLFHSLRHERPHLVVISGDLTQRAKETQYLEATRFLRRLAYPLLVIPGNHDIPLWNVFKRFLRPLEGYRRHVSTDLSPAYVDNELAVLGVNTARSLTFKNGRISREQMVMIHKFFCDSDRGNQFRILVTHHPFISPPNTRKGTIVGRAAKLLHTLRDCRLDILLSGHLHMSFIGNTHSVFTVENQSILAIQAGTAISSRIRANEGNAWNLITIDDGDVMLSVREWKENAFVEIRRCRFRMNHHEKWENRFIQCDDKKTP